MPAGTNAFYRSELLAIGKKVPTFQNGAVQRRAPPRSIATFRHLRFVFAIAPIGGRPWHAGAAATAGVLARALAAQCRYTAQICLLTTPGCRHQSTADEAAFLSFY